MTCYIGAISWLAGAFFTVVTHGRRPLFKHAAAVDMLRVAFRRVREKHPYEIDAIVILPDHLHTIWTLPSGDADYPLRWRLVKSWFTKHWVLDGAKGVGRNGRVWQNRYWEHTLRDERDFERHVDYIHWNPVKHGYVDVPMDWAWSSLGRFVYADQVSRLFAAER